MIKSGTVFSPESDMLPLRESASADPQSGAATKMQRRVATDVDDHAANLTNWNQLYDQLTPGCFEGRLNEFWLGRLQIFEEFTSQAIRQSCQTWANSWWFGIPVTGQAPGKIGPQPIESDMIAVRPGGVEFELLTPPGFRIFGIVVDHDALVNYIHEAEQRQPPASFLREQVLRLTPQHRRGLEQKLRQVFAINPSCLTYRQARRMLCEDILGSIATFVARHVSCDEPSPVHRGHYWFVRRAREYLLAHQDEPLSILDLCRTLRVSRRTLQYAFQDVLGVSPGVYLRTVRLNGVRRELRRSRVAVQDAAARWGFWHLSQFACDYRRLFGERPSETLLRGDRAAHKAERDLRVRYCETE